MCRASISCVSVCRGREGGREGGGDNELACVTKLAASGWGTEIHTQTAIYQLCHLFLSLILDKALFMEVTDEQRKLAQQARMYGEQMQALSESAGGKKVCALYCIYQFKHLENVYYFDYSRQCCAMFLSAVVRYFAMIRT